jgi:hypothetical protein
MRLNQGPRRQPARSQSEIAAERFLEHLGEMDAAERARAARSGELSHAERALWAARYPDEVPIVNGELEWIALTLADLD